MEKCEFCDTQATHETIFYASEGSSSEDAMRSVCQRHYLEFEHGIVTVVCDSCNLPTLLDDDYYYHLEQIFCAHCGHQMQNKEWIHRIKSETFESND